MARGRLVVGGHACACLRGPASRPELSQPLLGQKPSPGALPLFFLPYRGSPLRMEEQGDLRSSGDGTDGSSGLPPRRPVARTPAPCVRAPWRQRAANPGMQVSCAGQGTAWSLPGRERAPGPRESFLEIPRPWPQWLLWPPQAPLTEMRPPSLPQTQVAPVRSVPIPHQARTFL